MTDQIDVVVRGITDEQAFRVITAITTNTVQQIVSLQGAEDKAAEVLSNMVTGTMMIRETMSPQLRVQGLLRSADGTASVVADARPDGTNRGLLTLARGARQVTLGEGTLLQVMRTLPNGSLHQGVVQLSDAHDLSDAFMIYMHESEQIKTNIAVGSMVNKDRVLVAGGYFVQLLPELSDETLAIMIERLEKMPPIEHVLAREETTARSMMEELLGEIPFSYTSEGPVTFGCNCSHDKILAGLATLARPELQEMIDEAKPLTINCDYCGKEYEVTIPQLEGLISQN